MAGDNVIGKQIPVARPLLGQAELEEVKRVLESGWVTQGPAVERFEAAVGRVCGAEHAVAVTSCTAALHLSLVCAGIGPGDEVIVPSMSFIATANSVVHAGATPVFAEVDPTTFNLDIDDVARRIGPDTRAIMLVHQLGLPADIDAFARLAEEHGLLVIEDAACALGSTYRGAPIGSHGSFVCFSFHPRKVITTGEGGMVLVRSAEHAERLRLLRAQGMDVSDADRHRSSRVVRERYPLIGFNQRMSDVHAAIGLAQIERLDDLLAMRRRLAAVYDDALAGHRTIRTPVVPAEVEWNVQSYAVRIDGFQAAQRDQVMQILKDQGVSTRPGVMTAHREPAYRDRHAVSLPLSEAASDGSLVLPLHHEMDEDDCRAVADLLARAVDEVRPATRATHG